MLFHAGRILCISTLIRSSSVRKLQGLVPQNLLDEARKTIDISDRVPFVLLKVISETSRGLNGFFGNDATELLNIL